MVVVKRKQGASVDMLMHQFNRLTRDEDLQGELKKRVRFLRNSDARIEKTKRKQRKVAMQRRRKLQS